MDDRIEKRREHVVNMILNSKVKDKDGNLISLTEWFDLPEQVAKRERDNDNTK